MNKTKNKHIKSFVCKLKKQFFNAKKLPLTPLISDVLAEVRGRGRDLVIAVASRKGFGRDQNSVQTVAGNDLNHRVTESSLN